MVHYHLQFRNAEASAFTKAKQGSIFNQLYKQRMTDESFSKLSTHIAIRNYLTMGPKHAFYTSLDSIPEDVTCKVLQK